MLVKKYKNRKLYDVQASKYVNLTDIRNAIVSGDHVEVIDNVTKKDITSETLAQVLVKLETLGSVDLLHSMIRHQ